MPSCTYSCLTSSPSSVSPGSPTRYHLSSMPISMRGRNPYIIQAEFKDLPTFHGSSSSAPFSSDSYFFASR